VRVLAVGAVRVDEWREGAVPFPSVRVDQGAQEADCTISASEETFRQIVSGDQNPTSAYMTGKLKIKGDMGAAMKLQKLF
jgi:putative sterol carrier protein